MDDGPSADLVDVSPIGSPDRFRLIVEQRWRTEEPQSDAESEGTSNIAGDANHRRGSPRWLPRPLRGLRGLKHLTLDIDSPPTFPYSPGYPSIVESAPSSSPCTPDYFDLGGDILLPPAKFDDNMRFHRFPHLSIHVRGIYLVNPAPSLPFLTVNRSPRVLTMHARGIPTPGFPRSGTQGTIPMGRSPQTASRSPTSPQQWHQNSSW